MRIGDHVRILKVNSYDGYEDSIYRKYINQTGIITTIDSNSFQPYRVKFDSDVAINTLWCHKVELVYPEYSLPEELFVIC